MYVYSLYGDLEPSVTETLITQAAVYLLYGEPSVTETLITQAAKLTIFTIVTNVNALLYPQGLIQKKNLKMFRDPPPPVKVSIDIAIQQKHSS